MKKIPLTALQARLKAYLLSLPRESATETECTLRTPPLTDIRYALHLVNEMAAKAVLDGLQRAGHARIGPLFTVVVLV